MLKRIVLPFLLFLLTMGYSVCSADEAATEAEMATVRAPLDFPGMVFVKETVASKYLPSTAAYHIMLDGPAARTGSEHPPIRQVPPLRSPTLLARLRPDELHRF